MFLYIHSESYKTTVPTASRTSSGAIHERDKWTLGMRGTIYEIDEIDKWPLAMQSTIYKIELDTTGILRTTTFLGTSP